MQKYQLNRPIGAVQLKEPLTATTIPAQSIIRVTGPSKEVAGCVDVECDGHLYAVFQHDIDDCGVKVVSA